MLIIGGLSSGIVNEVAKYQAVESIIQLEQDEVLRTFIEFKLAEIPLLLIKQLYFPNIKYLEVVVIATWQFYSFLKHNISGI